MKRKDKGNEATTFSINKKHKYKDIYLYICIYIYKHMFLIK